MEYIVSIILGINGGLVSLASSLSISGSSLHHLTSTFDDSQAGYLQQHSSKTRPTSDKPEEYSFQITYLHIFQRGCTNLYRY